MKRQSLFSECDFSQPPPALSISKCGRCGLYKRCSSPKMPPTGRGRRKTLVIAQSPGREEDRAGVQLIGPAGKCLRGHLREIGVDLDEDCWKDNSVRCHPGEGDDGESTKVNSVHVECCRPNIFKTIEDLNPERIILLGSEAVQSVLGFLWKDDTEDTGAISKWVGWKIPSQRLNCWICPTFHPSWLIRAPDLVKDLLFREHLYEAFQLEGRPWPNGLPDYLGKVERIYEPEEAAYRLRKMVERGGLFSWDLETSCLKPDGPDARIVSCAVCRDGEEVIAFPWCGEVVKVMGEFVQSKHPKIGWNQKYEQRWIRRVFGFGVRNWVWDGMIGSHVLDTRKGITSLKFQAFVHFGVDSWDGSVGPFLQAKGGNERNRIGDCDMRDILLYNGMDSLMEYLVGVKQMKSINFKF